MNYLRDQYPETRSSIRLPRNNFALILLDYCRNINLKRDILVFNSFKKHHYHFKHLH